MTRDWRDAATALFDGLLARTHLSRPSDVAGVVVEEAQASLDAAEVVVYWVNREQSALVPLAAPASPHRDPQPIDSTVAGRCFASSTILSVPGSTIGRIKMFVPVLDGTERVGVLELEVPADDDRVSDEVVLVLERFAHATAMALVAKMVYGDSLELVQRSRAMDLGAELLWSVVPPLTFATDGLVISAMLEPAYENGGDAFDYAVNEDLVHVAILDGVGHGLPAAGLSTFAIAAYRHSRRTGLDLPGTFKAIDAAIADNFPDNRFVTGLLGQLDPSTGSSDGSTPAIIHPCCSATVASSRSSTPNRPPPSESPCTTARSTWPRSISSQATRSSSTPMGPSRHAARTAHSSGSMGLSGSWNAKRPPSRPPPRHCDGSSARYWAPRAPSSTTTPPSCSWSGAAAARSDCYLKPCTSESGGPCRIVESSRETCIRLTPIACPMSDGDRSSRDPNLTMSRSR